MKGLENELLGAASSASLLDPRLSASIGTFLAERPPGADEDVHMVSALVDHIIERCSRPGDLVFDPFAGYGTTLERAITLGRNAMGIELLPERADYLQERIPGALVIEGDARELLALVGSAAPKVGLSGVDLVLTSPPYMTSTFHESDPLTGYEENNGDYGRYLCELGLVAAQCARLVVPGGYVIWNVADIHHMGRTTHLISDCARVLGEHLVPAGVTEIVWDEYPHDLIADALLVFRRPPGTA